MAIYFSKPVHVATLISRHRYLIKHLETLKKKNASHKEIRKIRYSLKKLSKYNQYIDDYNSIKNYKISNADIARHCIFVKDIASKCRKIRENKRFSIHNDIISLDNAINYGKIENRKRICNKLLRVCHFTGLDSYPGSKYQFIKPRNIKNDYGKYILSGKNAAGLLEFINNEGWKVRNNVEKKTIQCRIDGKWQELSSIKNIVIKKMIDKYKYHDPVYNCNWKCKFSNKQYDTACMDLKNPAYALKEYRK